MSWWQRRSASADAVVAGATVMPDIGREMFANLCRQCGDQLPLRLRAIRRAEAGKAVGASPAVGIGKAQAGRMQYRRQQLVAQRQPEQRQPGPSGFAPKLARDTVPVMQACFDACPRAIKVAGRA